MGVPQRGSEQFMDEWIETGIKDKFIKKNALFIPNSLLYHLGTNLLAFCKGICNGKHATLNIAK